MSRLARARHGFTVDRVSGAADLAVKFAAIVVAVGAVAVVFFGPKIEITTDRQSFIDRGVLRRSYVRAGEQLPPVVSRIAGDYNEANTRDLLLNTNETADKLSASSLCRDHADLIRLVFPATSCAAADPVLGRNHFYERMLIDRVSKQTDLTLDQQGALASTALPRIYAAQYIKIRTLVGNTGHARAINVNVRVPNGFQPASDEQSVSPFTLSSDDPPVERFYRTATGIRESEVTRSPTGDTEGAPVTRFAVDWERDQNAQAGVVVWVGAALFVLWVAIVLNDSRLRAREARREAGAAATSND